jgi:pyrroline-5-carboxylate reductase
LAGARAGLQTEIAHRLAKATMEGTGAVLSRSPQTATQLREDVASTGGATQAGLQVLAEDDRLMKLIAQAVDAAASRSRELAGS